MRTLLFLFYILSFFRLPAQISFEGTEYGNGYKHAYAHDLTETNTHEFIFCGGTTTHGGFTGYNFLAKLDAFGNKLWEKNYHVCGEEGVGSINIMNDGSYLISGGGEYFCNGQQLIFMYLVHTDTAGNVLWTNTLGGDTMNVYYNDVISDRDGGVVAIGQVMYDTISLTYTSFKKFDSAGNLLFEKQFPYTDYFKQIIQTPDSTYYILGLPGSPVVYHLDINANLISTYLIIDSNFISGNEMVRDFKYKDGVLYSCLQGFNTSLGMNGQYFHEYDIANGTSKTYASDSLVCSFYPLDNKAKLILSTCSNNNWFQYYPAPPVNTYIQKIDSNQVPLWSYCIHPQVGILSLEFNKSSDNGCLIAAPIDTFFQDQYESMYYLKLDSNGNVLSVNDREEENRVTIYPNPFHSEFTVLSTLKIITVNIYSFDGQLVFDEKNYSEETIGSGLKSGIYFIVLETDQGRIIRKIIKC